MPKQSGPVGKALPEESAIEADDVAAALLAAIETGEFLVLPHPEFGAMYAGRAADPERWLTGMRRQNSSLSAQWTPAADPAAGPAAGPAAQSFGPPAT